MGIRPRGYYPAYGYYPVDYGWQAIQEPGAARFADVLRTTAIAGGGVILAPTFIIGEDLRAGRLVRLLADYPPPEQGLHALYPPGRHLSAKVRSFVDFLVDRFGGEPAWDRA